MNRGGILLVFGTSLTCFEVDAPQIPRVHLPLLPVSTAFCVVNLVLHCPSLMFGPACVGMHSHVTGPQRGNIVRIPVDRGLVAKELREAEQDCMLHTGKIR